MKKDNKVINHGMFRDDINYNGLIDAQASNEIFLENNIIKDSSKNTENSKAKKLTKCYIRGRINK